MIKRSIIFAACLLMCAVVAPAARAEWPDHPIRWVVGFGPGGANDLIARFAAEGVGKRLGQTVVIENRPGAGAVIAGRDTAAGALRSFAITRSVMSRFLSAAMIGEP